MEQFHEKFCVEGQNLKMDWGVCHSIEQKEHFGLYIVIKQQRWQIKTLRKFRWERLWIEQDK